MKSTLFAAVAIASLSLPSIVSAQTPAAADEASAPLNGSTPIETLMASPVAKPIILKHFPNLDKHAAYESFKAISLRDLAPLSGGLINEEQILAFETELKAAK
jgi:hypothetical protein